MALTDDNTDTSRLKDGRLATGISVLDTEILQGIPKGSTVAVLGEPTGMAELLLYHLVLTGRDTHYLTTVRPEQSIRNSLNDVGDIENTPLQFDDLYASAEDSSELIRKHVGRLQEGSNLIIDTYSRTFEEDKPDDFLQTSRNLYQKVDAKDALAYLYFSTNDPDTLSRAEQEVIQMCDVIFRINTSSSGDNIDTRLEILRLRGGDFPDKHVKLDVGTKLTVDTTRDIA